MDAAICTGFGGFRSDRKQQHVRPNHLSGFFRFSAPDQPNCSQTKFYFSIYLDNLDERDVKMPI